MAHLFDAMVQVEGDSEPGEDGLVGGITSLSLKWAIE